MKTLLSIFLAVIFATIANAEDTSFFEQTYKIDLSDLPPKSQHTDIDAYYTAIAKRIDIQKIAEDAVKERFGWERNPRIFSGAIVRRSEGKWTVLIFRLGKTDGGNPDTTNNEQVFVQIDDAKRVTYIGSEQPKQNEK